MATVGAPSCYSSSASGRQATAAKPEPPTTPATSAVTLTLILTRTRTLTRRRLGPKRASKIRKLFALNKDDDVRKYVIRRELTGKEKEGKKPPSKAPKIQRLVTPISLQRKRHRLSLKKNQQLKAKAEAAAYVALVAQRKQEAREKHAEKVSQRRSARSSRASEE